MGFLDFFQSTPSPERFATIAVEGLRAAGHSTPIAIDQPNFRLLLGADGEVTFNLDNFYRDYCRVSKGERYRPANFPDRAARDALPATEL